MILVLALAAAALVVVLVGLAVTETSLTRISTARADVLVDEGSPNAELLRDALETRAALLGPVLLARVAVTVALATLIAIAANDRLGTGGVVLVVAVEIVVVFVLVARASAKALVQVDSAALGSMPIANRLGFVRPARWAMASSAARQGASVAVAESTRPAVSEEELLAVAEQAAYDNAIDVNEQRMIEATIEFGDTIVSAIMVPRTDMITLHSGFACEDALQVVALNGFSRLPVTGERGQDQIIGIAHAKDLMARHLDGRGRDDIDLVMRTPQFIPETKRIATLMREMQAGKYHLAIVIDEYGGTAGFVTLEDVLEELVGEIVDEFDNEEPLMTTLADGGVLVSGRAALADIEELGLRYPDGDFATVGGLLFTHAERVPLTDEVFVIGDHRFVIEEMVGTRIAKVLILPVFDQRAVASPSVALEP